MSDNDDNVPTFISEDKLKQLKRIDYSKCAYVPPSSHRLRKALLQEKKEASKTRNKGSGPRSITYGCDMIGTPLCKFIYIPTPFGTTPAPRKYSIRYIETASSEPAQAKPVFQQIPPGIIISHSIFGLGNKTDQNDVPLNRKFNIVTIHGLYKKDENGVLTDEIDTYPVFSHFHEDEWYLKNPYKRPSEDQRSLKYEVEKCFKSVNNTLNQSADFLLNATDIITDCPTRYKSISDKAEIGAGVWVKNMIRRHKMGDPEVPVEMDADEWKLTEQYQNEVLPQAKLYGIKAIMSNPMVYEIKVEKFRLVLINSYLHDLQRTSAGRGKNEKEQQEMAIQMADEFIENNPDWEERLAILRFERKVWQPSEGVKNDLVEQEKIKTAVTKRYVRITEEVQKKNPSLTGFPLQRKADEVLVQFIDRKYKWVYNFPKIVDNQGREISEPTHENAMDKYTKPHYGLSIGTLVTFNFMVNLSVPTSATTPYGLKFNFFGFIQFITGVSYTLDTTQKMNTIDYGDDQQQIEKAFERNKINIEEKTKKSNAASSSSSFEQTKFILGSEPLKIDFKDAALNEYARENGESSDEFESNNMTNNDEADNDKKKKKQSVYDDDSSDSESSSSSSDDSDYKSKSKKRDRKSSKNDKKSSKKHAKR